MELASDNYHLLPGQQRPGWDALSGGTRKSPEVPMALPITEIRPGFLSPLPRQHTAPEPPSPPRIVANNTPPSQATYVEPRRVPVVPEAAPVQDSPSEAQVSRAVQQDECALLNMAAMLLSFRGSRQSGVELHQPVSPGPPQAPVKQCRDGEGD
jgi:hypothetical protein